MAARRAEVLGGWEDKILYQGKGCSPTAKPDRQVRMYHRRGEPPRPTIFTEFPSIPHPLGLAEWMENNPARKWQLLSSYEYGWGFPICSPSVKGDMQDMADFRRRVLEIAIQQFPGHEFTTDTGHPGIILWRDTKIGLTNILAKFQGSEKPDDELSQLVEEHFSQIIHDESPSLDDLSLADVKSRFRPQIMPQEYADVAPLPIVSFPLAGGIRIGIVADFPHTYLFIRQIDLQRWDLSEDQIRTIALENLNLASDRIQFHVNGETPDVFIAIAEGDGYDAARILIPDIQKFLASRLGENFRFGIPNRDFLICWPMSCATSFHDQLRQNVATDYSQQPYPLSPSVFVRNSEGNFHEQSMS